MRVFTIAWMAILLTFVISGGWVAATPVEITLDNPGATFVRTWSTGTMSADKYVSDYRFVTVSTAGGAMATYTPVIPYASGGNRPSLENGR